MRILQPARKSPAPRPSHARLGAAAYLVAALSAAVSCNVCALDTLLDDFESSAAPAPWSFYAGTEFPGATGSLNSGPGHSGKGAVLAFDFSGGGHYVSATLTLPAPRAAGGLSYWVKSQGGVHASVRVRDSGGQTLQYNVSRPLEAMQPGAWYRQVVQLDAPTSHFGGANDGVLHPPITTITLMAADPVESGLAGSVTFDDVALIDTLAPALDPRAPLSPAPAGAAELASRMAVNIHFTQDDRALEIARAAGFTIVRMDLGWGGVERAKGVYDFAALDGLVSALTLRSMRLHLILDYTNPLYPALDAASFGATTVPAFAALAKAVAQHFAGKAVSYEIWNEPNLAGFWPPAPDAVRYAQLCSAAVAAIHAGDTNAVVSTAGISDFDYAYLRSYLGAQGGMGADAIGVHPYRQSAPETLTDALVWMRQVVSSVATSAAPVWDTEWGYSATWYGDGHATAARQIQGMYALRELLAAWAVGFPLAVYYDLRDDGTDGSNAEHNFGLVQNDYSDKPAAVLVRTLAQVARGRSLAGFVPLTPSSVHALRLDGPSDRVFVLWSDAPASTLNVTLDGTPTATDALGQALDTSQHVVTLHESAGPIYLTYREPAAADGGAAVVDDAALPTGSEGRAVDASVGVGSSADAAAEGMDASTDASGRASVARQRSSHCGCSAPGSGRPSPSATAVLALVALGLCRRRSRRALPGRA